MKINKIMFILVCFLLIGCGKNEEGISYVKNEKILKYDEFLLWATDLSADMAQQKYESSKVNGEGLVERDYGHALITYSGEIAPKIVKLKMVRPNLACPRGVFLGNPVEKIEAYYHAAEDEYGRGLNYFYKDTGNGNAKYAYGIQGKEKIELGAASENANGTFTYLKLEYFIQDGVVESMEYTADFEKDEMEMIRLLDRAESGIG